jgi:hypothetical protein
MYKQSAFYIFARLSPTPRDLDGTFRLRGDRLRDRTPQRAFGPPVTVRADDDQVRAPSLGLLYDSRAALQKPVIAVAKPGFGFFFALALEIHLALSMLRSGRD